MTAILQVPSTAKLSEFGDFYSDRRFPLGTKMVTYDGREFRFGENDATIDVAGTLYQSEVPNAADDDLACAATAVGSLTVSITSNAEAIVADEFNGGYLVVQDDAGEGRAYLVEDTPTGSASTAGVVITLAHGIEVALTAATTVALLKHPLKDVVITPNAANPTAPVVGVAAAAITGDEFGWYQQRGMASVLTEGTVVIGQEVRPSETTTGCVTAQDYDEADDANIGSIGVVAEVAVTTEHSAVILSIRM